MTLQYTQGDMIIDLVLAYVLNDTHLQCMTEGRVVQLGEITPSICIVSTGCEFTACIRAASII
jgi:hypothetical protein